MAYALQIMYLILVKTRSDHKIKLDKNISYYDHGRYYMVIEFDIMDISKLHSRFLRPK